MPTHYHEKIKAVTEEKEEELYNSLALCTYCRTPFRECNTLIPGKGIVLGEVDVVEYKGRFWHYGCIFDYEKDNI